MRAKSARTTSAAPRPPCRSRPTRRSPRSTRSSRARKPKSSRFEGPPRRRTTLSGAAKYVAIITDGNGRWAQQRGLATIEGHQAGADVVKARLRDAVDLGIEELTVFSFSTENWSRSAEEVSGL